MDPTERGWIGGWSPQIGDPTPIGWLTVVAYFVAAWLAFRAFRNASAGASIRETFRHSFGPRASAHARVGLVWCSVSALLVFLGVNKQLDLQTALTELAKLVAIEGGWYADRRPVQIAFMAGLVLVALASFVALVRFGRPAFERLSIVIAGLVLLVLFVCVRAVSFHDVDALFGTDVRGFRLNWILELSGIAVLAYAAAREIRGLAVTPATTRR